MDRVWWAVLTWIACGEPPPPEPPVRAPLPEAGVAARQALAAALGHREDVAAVSTAARQAAQWQGRDDLLDTLLGDALANVLMRPDDGLEVLRSHPQPDSPEWRGAVAGAVLRRGDPDELRATVAELSLAQLPLDHPVVEQVVTVARQDPLVGWDTLASTVEDCTLLDRAQRRGLRELDLPVPANLVEVARAEGARRVVVGRPPTATEAERLGRPFVCSVHALVDAAHFVEPMPRNLVVVVDRGDEVLTLWVRPEGEGPWGYAASDAAAAARLIASAQAVSTSRTE